MIKVAYIFGSINPGGKKNLALEYCRHMDSSKVRVDWICDADSTAIPEDEIRALGGKVHIVTPYKNIMKNMSDIRKVFRQEKYDVLHVWLSTMNLFSLIVAKQEGIKVRISESISMANKHEKKVLLKYALKPFSSIGANYFMACGVDCGVFQFGRKAYEEGKIAIFKTVINTEDNAFDPELRAETRKKLGWEDSVVYGFIGRYMVQKNPLFIVEIFNEIVKIQSNARLALIGFGGLEEKMMEKIEHYGLSEKAINYGKREDIKQFYNAFDAFLLPSIYEGLPVVGVEAQSCGLPIFFSTAITPEAKGCDMAHFISLKESAAEWAKKIVTAVNKNMPVRRSYVEEMKVAGFDSYSESKRLQEYYMNAINEQTNK